MRSSYLMTYDAATSDVVAPPQTADEGGMQLRYVDAEGRVRGGRADASPKPPGTGGSVLVLVDADAATHTALQADPRYCWVEDQ